MYITALQVINTGGNEISICMMKRKMTWKNVPYVAWSFQSHYPWSLNLRSIDVDLDHGVQFMNELRRLSNLETSTWCITTWQLHGPSVVTTVTLTVVVQVQQTTSYSLPPPYLTAKKRPANTITKISHITISACCLPGQLSFTTGIHSTTNSTHIDWPWGMYKLRNILHNGWLIYVWQKK